ncbi:MAG: hypothetical protein KIS73_23065 [Enhydrobacter sp.]|nr:hypothetical protein [Enhydrobacter sp.]
MTPDDFYLRIVEPTLHWMAAAPGIAIPATDRARVLLMAIAGQESGWTARRQIGGPARSYWQFEKGGGVDDVFRATSRQLGIVCAAQDIPCDRTVVFEAMAWNDSLACAMARLLLWMEPAPLPAVGEKEAAWQYYLRNWRPGAPHRHSWDARYDQALAAIGRRA